MKTIKRGFGSDNHAPIHPALLASLQDANVGHYPSYGNDPWTEQVQECFRQLFGPQVESSFVFNGTAANTLAIKSCLQTYQAVICSDISHVYWDECGAPEFIAGTKLIPVKTHNGKIIPEHLDEVWVRRGDQHFSQAQMISITQPTEVGTVYTIVELKKIIDWAKSKKLLVHIDGARLANAAVFLNSSFKEFTTDLGVDIVSFGGSKNGFMLGEAVLFLNPALYKDFKFIRKQCLQLPSKSRFIATQFLAYFKNDLWKEIATHSCSKARHLADELEKVAKFKITYPVESNAVFVQIPQNLVKLIREDYFFYVWNEKDFTCRIMMCWDTQDEDIKGFIQSVKKYIG
jgi:threonine aldolase